MKSHTPTAIPKSPHSQVTASGHANARAPTACAGKSILLADDDPGVRESLAAVLRSDGYDVLPAIDGQEALKLASTRRIDLVLLDLNMPKKSGWDTFERLTAMNPLLPVIILTARPNQLFTAIGAGVGALVEKPPDIPRLLETVNTLLAEAPETRLERIAGRSSTFHYLASGGERE